MDYYKPDEARLTLARTLGKGVYAFLFSGSTFSRVSATLTFPLILGILVAEGMAPRVVRCVYATHLLSVQ